MTAEIVNLRRVRKAKVRLLKDAAAAENRASHGRSKAEKQGTAAETRQSNQKLDGKRLDHDPEEKS